MELLHIHNLTALKKFKMKKLLKTFAIASLLITNMACAQTFVKSVNDAKKLEINKKEFVGKSLNYFLKHVNIDIKSVRPTPNKNLNEINRISFLFVPYNNYRNDSRDITQKPTSVTVVFNQNSDLVGERCRFDIPGCTEWTKNDQKNIGNLIVDDIYVNGKN